MLDSPFSESFFLHVQDQVERPDPIDWPDEFVMALEKVVAPESPAAGLFLDGSVLPEVELRDAATHLPIDDLEVQVGAPQPEDPSLHPSVAQRVIYPCAVAFTGDAMFTGLAAGDRRELEVVVTLRDRAGNVRTDDGGRVWLQADANPFMLDGEVSWLSMDTRVFKVSQGDERFAVGPGWTDPNAFITQTIENLRTGTAGTDSFEDLPTGQSASALELAETLGGQPVYNFAPILPRGSSRQRRVHEQPARPCEFLRLRPHRSGRPALLLRRLARHQPVDRAVAHHTGVRERTLTLSGSRRVLGPREGARVDLEALETMLGSTVLGQSPGHGEGGG